jgi:hypothetical protein
MIISLSIERPDVEVLAINIANKTVDFKDVDGVCNCPYVSEEDIPTEAELKAGIEAVLGESLVIPVAENISTIKLV